MISHLYANVGAGRRQTHPALAMVLTLLLIAALLAPVSTAALPGAGTDLVKAPIQAAAAPRAQATTNAITLEVISARTEPLAGVVEGQVVTGPYKWQIVEDNTGDPNDTTDCFAYTDPPTNTVRNPNYPDGCEWPGVHVTPGWAPIVTQGTEADLNELTSITLPGTALAPKKYLISVLADGYKVDGEHFTIPMNVPVAGPGLITVAAHPLPLPTAQMEIKVFNDNSMTNGQFDAPVEQAEAGPKSMAGFRAILNDTVGEITNDMFGNPLCTEYAKDANGNVIVDAEGVPTTITKIGGQCLSDDTGTIIIPNIGTIRFDVLVAPPDGSTWIQTTTLEGSNGWDTWLQEAGTGLDNEFIVAGEPFPWTIFGYVQPSTSTLPVIANGGSIKGVIMGITTYSPSQGGLPHNGDIWGGLMGVKLDEPIAYPWLSLNGLQTGDTALWIGQGNADGSFQIDNIPPGDYFLTYWDEKQHYILDFVQVSVPASTTVDVGVRTMTNWFTKWYGTVFLDDNENGRQDPGESGLADYLVVLRDRDNTEIDRMSIASVTDANGHYALEKGYPMTAWMVLEAYNDLYRTTGVTYQASNAKEETTVLGGIVDVGVLPIFSQWGRLDWGVKRYEVGTNGGIAGTVFYDTVRAEDNAQYAGAEPWQPGIPDLTLKLWDTVPCGTNVGVACDASLRFEVAADGSLAKGALLNETVTENYVRPKDCQPLDVYGDPVDFPALPPSTGGYDCLEAPMMGVQFTKGQQELPGNYGFGEIYTPSMTAPGATLEPIPPGDYLVEVIIPNDPILGRPLYQVTREEDSNIFDGDTFTPQVIPPACAGPMHTVDLAGIAPDGTLTTTMDGPNAIVNPGFVDAGGSRYEGQSMPLCNVKQVTVEDQKGIAPIFTMWTPVPLPGRWRGYIIDDLNVSSNPLEMFFGEKAGMHNMPIGIYDYTGRLVHTVHSDFHGVYEVLLPSSATYNAPTPSGMLAGMYYIYGNDPGQPGAFNANYHPGYRSIGTTFEVYPGVMVPSDLAPTQNGALIWNPASNVSQLATCAPEPQVPQLFAVDKPYVVGSGRITISGVGFGPRHGVFAGNQLPSTPVSVWLPVVSWTDREIVVDVPAGTPPGPYWLRVMAWKDGKQWEAIPGLTIHVLGPGYEPAVYEAGPGRPYGTIQSAIDAAANTAESLVVVYPGVTSPFTNPLGIWLENPVIYSPIKLQGVGPGGVYTDGTGVLGSVIDGRGMGGTEVYAEWWRLMVGDIWLNRGGWDGSLVDANGDPRLYEGQVITVFAEDGEFTPDFAASIDGFAIQGGDQQGFPNNLDQNGGAPIPGVPAQVVIQGGGIFVNAYARYLRITNNLISNNGGAYAGGIRIGTPDLPPAFKDQQNDYLYIARNRIIGNGGTNLAGGIGIFNGAEGYTVAWNDICGNFSAEYGGGVSHYGYSNGSYIAANRIYFNRAYDEGGGIMIAGELPTDPNALSPGAGSVQVDGNLILGNLANDDGGGLRFLMAGGHWFVVHNNIIANNVSTHEGGGVSLNDATLVYFDSNTIMNNITTATSMTSNGLAAPAGLASSKNSDLMQATLPAGSPNFSNPLMFNNLFWDNRAGTWTGGGVAGIGLQGDPSPIFNWDLGVAGGFGTLSPVATLMQVANGAPDPSNIVGQDPLVLSSYDSSVRVFPWRGNTNFVGADIVAVELPGGILDNFYHVAPNSPAVNMGATSQGGWPPPHRDYDGDYRPSFGGYEAGADETTIEFPAAGVLFGAAAFQARPAAEPLQGAAFTLYLPLVAKNGGMTAAWTGNEESFDLNPVTGVTVKDSGVLIWNKAMFAADQEVYMTFTHVGNTATRQDLLLKIDGLADGAIGPDTRLIDLAIDVTTGRIEVKTLSPGQVWTTHAILIGYPVVDGDRLGARATQDGIVEIYSNDVRLGQADLSAGAQPWAFNDQGGWIGTWFEGPSFAGADEAGFTDFGGGSLP